MLLPMATARRFPGRSQAGRDTGDAGRVVEVLQPLKAAVDRTQPGSPVTQDDLLEVRPWGGVHGHDVAYERTLLAVSREAWGDLHGFTHTVLCCAPQVVDVADQVFQDVSGMTCTGHPAYDAAHMEHAMYLVAAHLQAGIARFTAATPVFEGPFEVRYLK